MNRKFNNMIARKAEEEFPFEPKCSVYIINGSNDEDTIITHITIFSDKTRQKITEKIFSKLPKSAYDRFMKLYGDITKVLIKNTLENMDEVIDPDNYDDDDELKSDVSEFIVNEINDMVNEDPEFLELENMYRILGIFHNRILTCNFVENCESYGGFYVARGIKTYETPYGCSFYIRNPKIALKKDQEN